MSEERRRLHHHESVLLSKLLRILDPDPFYPELLEDFGGVVAVTGVSLVVFRYSPWPRLEVFLIEKNDSDELYVPSVVLRGHEGDQEALARLRDRHMGKLPERPPRLVATVRLPHATVQTVRLYAVLDYDYEGLGRWYHGEVPKLATESLPLLVRAREWASALGQ